VSTPLPRSEFAVTERLTYFNHAAVGVLPVSSRNALEAFLRAQAEGGVMGTYTYEANMPHYRERIGAFIGASGDEIAILRNTGDGANAIALGINWQHGDELILCDNEFPSNAIPWLALRERGVNVRLLPSGAGRLTPEALRRVISPAWRKYRIERARCFAWMQSKASAPFRSMCARSESTHSMRAERSGCSRCKA
jgi:selenocysteine lyase/cysteine desulfurase